MSFLKHYFSCLITISALALLCSCSGDVKGKRSDVVLVTLAPYKFFVEQIAGDTVDVKLVVPTGASPHSYEPTARQILEASKADIWFLIGETFEERAVQALTSYNTDLKTVDMRNGIELIEEREPGHEHCHHHGCEDPHIWMSPKLVKEQAETIAKTLSEIYPERAELYAKNLKDFQKKLDDLDAAIVQILQGMKNRTILVSHPAYAYYCKDYSLKQISIEFEGKDPSPHQLTKILQRARGNKSPYVYIQVQSPSKGAKLVADEIGAEIVDLDPYGENYFENMVHISKSFAKQ
jgi:zinc transport system substrate-binding protein